MPSLSRLFIKTSLIFFLLTFLSGAAFLLHQGFGGGFLPRHFIISHTHVALVGWLSLMVMGVAYWMFPLAKGRFPEGKRRYDPVLASWNYGLVVGGLVLRVLVEPFAVGGGGGFVGGLLALSGVAQALGVFLFVYGIWSRIRGIGSESA